MPIYKAPTRDTRFIVNEVVRVADYTHLAGFENATQDMTDAVIEEAGASFPKWSRRSTAWAISRAAPATPTLR
jgi:acyl-CoA reductase-like NAD-dependent aldehyde dehydrogenase